MKRGNSCDPCCDFATRSPHRFCILPVFLTLVVVLSSSSILILNSLIKLVITGHVQTQPPLSPTSIPPTPNATLLHLASSELADPYGIAEVDNFLRHFFTHEPSPPDPQPSFQSLVAHESANHLLTIRRRAARFSQDLPAFRRAFLSWSSKRRPEPGRIMFDIPSLLPRHRRCAVVGNSGILLHGSHGPHIDAHDLVIRLNNARISGFESYVGRKTNISFVNSNILYLCGLRVGCPCHPYGSDVPLVMYVCQAQHFLDYIICGGTSVGRPPLLLTDPRLDLLCARIVKYYSLKRFVESTGRPPEEWENVHNPQYFHYSSGMEAVVMALGICQEVNLFGFGKRSTAKHHYHTNQTKELDLHDYGAEYEFYDNLVWSPESIPFLGDFGFKIPSVSIYL